VNEYSLHSRAIKPLPLVNAVIALANSPRPLNREDIADVIDMSEAYTGSVVQVGLQLDLMAEVDQGLVANTEIEEEARKMSPEQGFVLVSRTLQRYQPFMTFVSYLEKGYSVERTAEVVKTLYEYDTSVDVIIRQFTTLGQFANLLDEEDASKPQIKVATISSDYVQDLDHALRSEAKSRLFVSGRLGDDVSAYADPESIEKLQEALLMHDQSPPNAIVSAVAASENITRELATEFGPEDSDYSKATGIGSLANMMRGDDLILKRHVHGANFLGAMRIPGAHGKESETLESWQVDSEVSLEVILSALSYIRSLYWCITERQQIL